MVFNAQYTDVLLHLHILKRHQGRYTEEKHVSLKIYLKILKPKSPSNTYELG